MCNRLPIERTRKRRPHGAGGVGVGTGEYAILARAGLRDTLRTKRNGGALVRSDRGTVRD